MVFQLKLRFEMMQKAVVKCPSESIICRGIKVPSLVDTGSEVTLLHQSYFNTHPKAIVSPSSHEKREAHSLFKVTTVNAE